MPDMVTIKEIAERLGLSATTVSNVIHGNTKEVSRQTIEKVERMLRDCQYVPNRNARTLAQHSSRIIGVVMRYHVSDERNAIQDPFNGELLGSLEASIREAGYYMMLYATSDPKEILALTLEWNVDGLILLGLHAKDCQHIKRQTDKPVVFIDCYFLSDGIDYANVGLEDRSAAYLMTQYLLRQGHSKIAFAADNRVGVDEERFQGYCDALREAGLPGSAPRFLMLDAQEEKLRICLDQIFAQIGTFTALFFASDYYAMRCIYDLQDRGVHVPEEFSVAGFDDNLLGRNMRPRLTTMRQDPTLKGKLAIEMLLRLIAGTVPEMFNIRLPAELIIRNTVAKRGSSGR